MPYSAGTWAATSHLSASAVADRGAAACSPGPGPADRDSANGGDGDGSGSGPRVRDVVRPGPATSKARKTRGDVVRDGEVRRAGAERPGALRLSSCRPPRGLGVGPAPWSPRTVNDQVCGARSATERLAQTDYRYAPGPTRARDAQHSARVWRPRSRPR